MGFDDVSILGNDKRKFVRLFLEASFTKNNSFSIKRSKETPAHYD